MQSVLSQNMKLQLSAGMRLKILPSCLLLVAALAVIPQSILSYSPTDTVTAIVTMVPVATATYQGRPIYCGEKAVLIPYTGSVHIDFRVRYASMDFYILTSDQLASFLGSLTFAVMPCAPPSKEEYVFGQSGVGNSHFDVNLPSGTLYYIFLIQCCGHPVANSVATITMNGTPVSVTVTPTSQRTTYQPTSMPYTSNVATTTSYAPSKTTSVSQLASDITSQLVLIAVFIAAVLLVALLVHSRRGKHPKTIAKAKKAAFVKVFCINCGKELPPKSKFCNNCGTKQP